MILTASLICLVLAFISFLLGSLRSVRKSELGSVREGTGSAGVNFEMM